MRLFLALVIGFLLVFMVLGEVEAKRDAHTDKVANHPKKTLQVVVENKKTTTGSGENVKMSKTVQTGTVCWDGSHARGCKIIDPFLPYDMEDFPTIIQEQSYGTQSKSTTRTR